MDDIKMYHKRMKNWYELDLSGSAVGFFANDTEFRDTQHQIR